MLPHIPPRYGECSFPRSQTRITINNRIHRTTIKMPMHHPLFVSAVEVQYHQESIPKTNLPSVSRTNCLILLSDLVSFDSVLSTFCSRSSSSLGERLSILFPIDKSVAVLTLRVHQSLYPSVLPARSALRLSL